MSKASEKDMLRCENCGQSPLMLLEKFEYEDIHCLSEDGRYIRDPILEEIQAKRNLSGDTTKK